MADDLTGSTGQGEATTKASPGTTVEETGSGRRDISLATIAGKYGLLIFFGAVLIAFSLLRPHTFPTGENAEVDPDPRRRPR